MDPLDLFRTDGDLAIQALNDTIAACFAAVPEGAPPPPWEAELLAVVPAHEDLVVEVAAAGGGGGGGSGAVAGLEWSNDLPVLSRTYLSLLLLGETLASSHPAPETPPLEQFA